MAHTVVTLAIKHPRWVYWGTLLLVLAAAALLPRVAIDTGPGDDLDRDISVELRVPCPEHRTHGALPYLVGELVALLERQAPGEGGVAVQLDDALRGDARGLV